MPIVLAHVHQVDSHVRHLVVQVVLVFILAKQVIHLLFQGIAAGEFVHRRELIHLGAPGLVGAQHAGGGAGRAAGALALPLTAPDAAAGVDRLLARGPADPRDQPSGLRAAGCGLCRENLGRMVAMPPADTSPAAAHILA